jgi:2-(1,2-epoxy-1,2-dihydrophenyl)acetyl-CoA isomerase
MGLVPDGGSTYTLPRLVGTEHASSILMSGETVDAERAQSIGLVSAVTSEDSLEAVAGALVERIASQSRRSVAQIKAEREGKAQVEALLSQEFRARLDAFLRRTKPL